MKEYISKKEFIGKDMLGRDITIPAYSEFDLKNKYLRYKNIPICSEYSQIAKDYLVYNGDGLGSRRMIYLESILNKKSKWKDSIDIYDDFGNYIKSEEVICTGLFSPLEVNYLKERYKKYIKSISPFMFNDDFYKAPIEDLKTISNFMERPKGNIKRDD